MRVELDRQTDNGLRTIHVIANDRAQSPETIREWIKMLRIAEIWLQEGQKKREAKS